MNQEYGFRIYMGEPKLVSDPEPISSAQDELESNTKVANLEKGQYFEVGLNPCVLIVIRTDNGVYVAHFPNPSKSDYLFDKLLNLISEEEVVNARVDLFGISNSEYNSNNQVELERGYVTKYLTDKGFLNIKEFYSTPGRTQEVIVNYSGEIQYNEKEYDFEDYSFDD